MSSGSDRAKRLAAALAAASLSERLHLTRRAVPGRLVFTTGFGLEGQAITHALFAGGSQPDVEILTLDTGRLFPETYDLWAETENRYGIRIPAYAGRTDALEALVADQGINGFRHSLDARKACCFTRKVEPLRRALAGADGWIAGLRAGQSAGRAAIPLAEFDETHGVIKINPLADWSRQDVERYIADNGVPYNALHDQGFSSIGCAPCTRPVRVGEPERAGRWWWEAQGKQECGLHLPGVAAEGRQAA